MGRARSTAMLLLCMICTGQAISLPALPALAIPEFPPWVWLGFVFNFANNIQTAKRTAGLAWGTLTGGKGAACGLCDQIVTRMLDVTGAGDATDGAEELECEEICPFKLKKCVSLCNKLKDAMDASSHYPCVAIQMCPEIDEYGEVPRCEFSWKQARCSPSYACKRTRTLPLPKCELNPGFKKWRQYTSMLNNNVNAIATAVKRLPKCGEEGADPTFCVNEPTGVGKMCDYFGWILVFVVATTLSVRAIETPGGDDDRQWLTFWMIYFGFAYFERVSAVLLSWFPLYYQCKLVLLVWLIFFSGASKFYGFLHSLFYWLRRKARYLFPKTLGTVFWQAPEQSEAEYIRSLEDFAEYAALGQLASIAKQQGIESVYSSFKSYADIKARHGMGMLRSLLKKWDELEVRRLEIKLVKATGLPIMDKSMVTGKPSSTDAYCVFSLIAPSSDASSLACAPLLNDSKGLSPTSSIQGFFARLFTFSKAPDGKGYHRTRSRVRWGTTNPTWGQLIEVGVEGGMIRENGQYVNREAPFVVLRVEVWDKDRLSSDDYIGDFQVPLGKLMDGRTHKIRGTLGDPENKGLGARVKGEVFLELKYGS